LKNGESAQEGPDQKKIMLKHSATCFEDVLYQVLDAEGTEGLYLADLTAKVKDYCAWPGPFLDLQPERRVRAVLIILKANKKVWYSQEQEKWFIRKPTQEESEPPPHPSGNIPDDLRGRPIQSLSIAELYDMVRSRNPT
jgi:hypothetical protein